MLILTPNRRLAAFSIRLHDQQNLQENKACWETAEIYPFASWLTQLWTGKPVLSKSQQQLLLEQIIQQSSVGVELLRIAPTAKNVLQAWDFLRGWQINLPRLDHYAKFSPNTAVFCTWIKEYLNWLEQNNYTDFNLMVDELITHLPEIKDKLPREICLRGMNNLSPQYKAVLNTLANCGVTLSHDQLIAPGAKTLRASFIDANAELEAAANWAMQSLKERPDQVIGVVVPDLETKRQQVANIFNTVVPQEWLNISAPLSLDNYPLINTALLLLQMAKPQINYTDLSIILRSPFTHAAVSEQNLRACLDRELRKTVEAKLSWQTTLKLLGPIDTKLKTIIAEFGSKIQDNSGYHNTEYWAEYFDQLLSIWGWPGERGLTTQESDLYSCWRELLDEYVKLAVIIKEHSYMQALQTLQHLAAQLPFLPAESGATKIHVLGLLEADGLYFDQLWISGMGIDAWPPEANPNPFIPLELQKQFDLPKSSPQRELKVAQNLTMHLQYGAKTTVIFSYPQSIDDYKTQASNLIAHLPEEAIAVTEQVQTSIAEELELFFDANSSSIAIGDTVGGTNILKLQAQCPFKAHAEIRMQAIALQEPQLILTKAQRGSIIHEVLEKFWAKCKTQQQLISWFPETVTEILLTIATEILEVWRLDYPNTLSDNYVNLEVNAVLNTVLRWLEYEMSRPAFSIKQLEHKRKISIGPLNISTRIDRIDQLMDGSTVIIDYKTGENRVSDWTSDPIIEPQLPIYALCEKENLSGIYYASLKNDDMKLKGINADDYDIPQLINEWLDTLIHTAIDFASGNASIKPYSPQICERCDLQGLCRIYDC